MREIFDSFCKYRCKFAGDKQRKLDEYNRKCFNANISERLDVELEYSPCEDCQIEEFIREVESVQYLY